MKPRSVHDAHGQAVMCPFLRQFATGTWQPICDSTMEPFSIGPDYAAAYCRTARHVGCSRYIAVRGRADANTHAALTGQPAVALSSPSDLHAGRLPRRGARLEWLVMAATQLANIGLIIGLLYLWPQRAPVDGLGAEPTRRPTSAAVSTAVPSPTSPRTSASSTPLPASSTPVPVVATVPPPLGSAVVDTSPERDGVNLRQEPSRSAAILRLIDHGERVRLLEGPRQGDGETWWRVDYQGQTGWVVAAFLRREP